MQTNKKLETIGSKWIFGKQKSLFYCILRHTKNGKNYNVRRRKRGKNESNFALLIKICQKTVLTKNSERDCSDL